MSSLVPFSFESREVRFIPNGDSFSVVAKDVLLALEYAEASNPARVIAHVPEEWKGVNPIHTLGGVQELLTLTEQGFYFFVNRSDKPKALPLQKWVAGDVLPSIRKTGSYSLPGATPQNAVLAAQLAEFLQGKVLVDYALLADLANTAYALRHMTLYTETVATQIEQQIGKPLINRSDDPPRPTPPAPARRPTARAVMPVSPWEAPIAEFLAGRDEVTQTEIFEQCLKEPKTQSAMNRVAHILRRLGYACETRRQGSRIIRLYVRISG